MNTHQLGGLVRWTYTPVLGSMPGLSFFTIFFFSLVLVLPTLGLHRGFMVYRVLGGGGFLFYSNDSLLRDFSSSLTLAPVLGFTACPRLHCLWHLLLALAPVLGLATCSRLCHLFSAFMPCPWHVHSFVACPGLWCLLSALLSVLDFDACSQLSPLAWTL